MIDHIVRRRKNCIKKNVYALSNKIIYKQIDNVLSTSRNDFQKNDTRYSGSCFLIMIVCFLMFRLFYRY